MRRLTRRSAWIAMALVGLSSAAFLLVRHPVPPRATDPAPSQAPSGARSGNAPPPGGEQPVTGGAAPPEAVPFAPRIYPATPASSEPAPSAPAAAPGSAPARLPSRSAGPASQTLPAGTPVSTVLGQLKAAADAGDRDAACRVGLELLRCASAPQLVTASTSGPVVSQAGCAGVAPVDQQSASRYLARASAAGSDAARRALAGDASVGPTDCGR